MDGSRTVRAIEAVVKQRVNLARISMGGNPGYAEESIAALRAELCELLRVLDELRCQLTPNTRLTQGGLELLHVVSVPSASVPVPVWFFVTIPLLSPC